MSSKYNITIGADPEFFVCDKKTLVPVPACRKFGGEKRAPMFLSPDGGYLEDGCAVEFNVTPSKTLKECRKKLQGLILIFLNQHPDYILSEYSNATFDKEVLEALPEAMQIGCSPDLFAYGLRNAPSIERFGTRRFAGGHVHLGIDPWPEGLDKVNVVKLMDSLLVFPMAGYIDSYRYEFYGHAGLYRDTPYGVEHRSPDNWWCNDGKLLKANSEYQEYFLGVIADFDKIITQQLKFILDKDEHGARLNDDLERVFKTWKMADLGDMSSTQNEKVLHSYRRCGRDMQHYFKSWISERSPPATPRGKLKFSVGA